MDNEEPDYWKEKFGDKKIAFCEICNEKKIIKNKSFYGFSKNSGEDIIRLECFQCFDKDMNSENSEEYDDKKRNKPFVDINNIYECASKVPFPYRTRDYIYGNKKKGKCAICECELRLRKDPCISWYKKLPIEGGDLSMDNFDLVCEDCSYDAIKHKKGIYKIREGFHK